MKLAIGYIATNEELMLKKFLPEISKAVNKNIVAIDYNSTDSTRELFEKYGKAVKTMEWTRHFGEAKTNLIKLAEEQEYDWLFVLDADETFDVRKIKNIINCIKQNDYDCYFFPRVNYAGIGIIDGNIQSFPDLQARLFKLNIGYHYRNVVHCLLYKGDDEQCAWELNYGAIIPIFLEHFKGLKSEIDNIISVAERESMAEGNSEIKEISQVKDTILEKTNKPLIIELH